VCELFQSKLLEGYDLKFSVLNDNKVRHLFGFRLKTEYFRLNIP
jgi:hypothetical protein